jgi:nucleotide-binding universal stress UspA family protein
VAYRRLSLLLDQDRLCAARTLTAIRLARRFDAHLFGIAPTGLLEVPISVEGAASLSDYAERARSAFEARALANVRAFSELCKGEGFDRFEAVVDIGDKGQLLTRHAQSSDLLLLSQPEPGTSGQREHAALVDHVVIASARPTLVLPHHERGLRPVGVRVLVGWDESREAARALADALPMLRLAEQVQVVHWNPTHSESHGLDERLAGLRQWLVLHSVRSDVRIENTRIGIAETLMSRAADLDVDLVVMGAYSRGPWAERVLGGVTRKLLASMTVPVLLSH